MNGDAEWGPWVEHDGKGCPVAAGTLVEALVVGFWTETGRRDSSSGLHHLGAWRALVDDDGDPWFFDRPGTVEVRLYRVRKPRALLDLIDLVENLPAPARQPSEVAP